MEKSQKGILSVDRYAAYKPIAKDNILVLAFCWAHVRRDFINHNKQYPALNSWTQGWLDDIGNLYRINNRRIQHETDSAEFSKYDKRLRNTIQGMQEKYILELNNEQLHPKSKKLLTSLQNHWNGLTVFVDNPTIPMDNNTAERQ